MGEIVGVTDSQIYIYMTLKEGMAICRFIVPQTTTALCDFEEGKGM
jgi:hypothetical protein